MLLIRNGEDSRTSILSVEVQSRVPRFRSTAAKIQGSGLASAISAAKNPRWRVGLVAEFPRQDVGMVAAEEDPRPASPRGRKDRASKKSEIFVMTS